MLVVRVLRAVRSVLKLTDAGGFDRRSSVIDTGSRDVVVVVVAGPMSSSLSSQVAVLGT